MNYEYSNRYKFTETWFDGMIPTWKQVFEWYEKEYPFKILNVLEIGCFEGRATIWLCENFLKHNDVTYDVIDTFQGSETESGMKNILMKVKEEENFIENNFRHNISFFENIKFNVHKGYSQKILPSFEECEKYDFIYIDASHRADDTFIDSYYANKLLKKGGLIIFDDFGWKDPNNLHPSNSPELGIKVFQMIYEHEYHKLFDGYQIGFIKK